MNCEPIEKLLTAYLLGDLPPDQADTVRRHLETCDRCQALARELEPTLGLLRDALAAAPSATPARLDPSRRAAILAELAPAATPREPWIFRRHAALALAAAVLVVVGFFAALLRVERRAARNFAGTIRADLELSRSLGEMDQRTAGGTPAPASEATVELFSRADRGAAVPPGDQPDVDRRSLATVAPGGEDSVIHWFRNGDGALTVSGTVVGNAGGPADGKRLSDGITGMHSVNGGAAGLDSGYTLYGKGTPAPAYEATVEQSPSTSRKAVVQQDKLKDLFAFSYDPGDLPKTAPGESGGEARQNSLTVKGGTAGKFETRPSPDEREIRHEGDKAVGRDAGPHIAGPGSSDHRYTEASNRPDKTERKLEENRERDRRMGERGEIREGREAAESKKETEDVRQGWGTEQGTGPAPQGGGGKGSGTRGPEEPSAPGVPATQPAQTETALRHKEDAGGFGWSERKPDDSPGADKPGRPSQAEGLRERQELSDGRRGIDETRANATANFDLSLREENGNQLADSPQSGEAEYKRKGEKTAELADRKGDTSGLGDRDGNGRTGGTGEAPAKPAARRASPAPAVVDSTRVVKSPVTLRGLYSDRTSGERGDGAEMDGDGIADSGSLAQLVINASGIVELTGKLSTMTNAAVLTPAPTDEPLARPRLKAYGVNPFVETAQSAFSTFSIDVDTASYTLARNYMTRGTLPPPEAVRTEEFVNFFDYEYAPPAEGVFRVHTAVAPSKFGHGLHLLEVGVKGRRLGREEQRQAVLTFLVDTSGSMDQPDRLGLVQKSLHLLVERLAPEDRVALVQYDSRARLVLAPTPAAEKATILAAVDGLQCTGATHLEEGMNRAYALAAQNFVPGAENRVLLLSDGVANLGSAAAADILRNVERHRAQGVYCSVLGFGRDTYDDATLEALADKGNGVYRFIDSEDEARRVLVDDLAATLNTIAADVKIQVEFYPDRVRRFRQLGYENRRLEKEDFRNDAVDAGEVGSGQSVTALYEVELAGDAGRPLGIVRVRYRRTDSGKVEEIEKPIAAADVLRSFDAAPARFRLAACAAEFAELLRGSPFAADGRFPDVADALRPVALDLSLDTRVQELLRLVSAAPGFSLPAP